MKTIERVEKDEEKRKIQEINEIAFLYRTDFIDGIFI